MSASAQMKGRERRLTEGQIPAGGTSVAGSMVLR